MFLIGDREFSNAIDVDLADKCKLSIQLEYTFLSNAPGTFSKTNKNKVIK